MAFNVVDQNDNHRGIVLGRYSINSEFAKTNSKVVWLVALTNYQVQDFGFNAISIKQSLAKRWGKITEYGTYDDNILYEQVERMVSGYKLDNLNYEEMTRVIYTWRFWLLEREKIEQKITSLGYVLVDPYLAVISNDSLIMDFPESFEKNSSDDRIPLYMQITQPPCIMVESFYRDNTYTAYPNNTVVKAICGNVNYELNIPYPINNLQQGDPVQLFYDINEVTYENNGLTMVYCNGIYYKRKVKSFW